MLTKAEVGKLPVEQQEILAQLELRKARHRQKLLEQVRGRDWRTRYSPLYNFAVFLICAIIYQFDFFHLQARSDIVFLVIGVGIVSALNFHVIRTNRRLDALLELLNLDHQQQLENRPYSKDEKVC